MVDPIKKRPDLTIALSQDVVECEAVTEVLPLVNIYLKIVCINRIVLL